MSAPDAIDERLRRALSTGRDLARAQAQRVVAAHVPAALAPVVEIAIDSALELLVTEIRLALAGSGRVDVVAGEGVEAVTVTRRP